MDVAQQLESLLLAQTESDFWTAASDLSKIAPLRGEQLIEYLTRVLLHGAPLKEPRDVAFFLASYARDARIRVEKYCRPSCAALDAERTGRCAWNAIRGEKGEHFFRSTLVQTIFYGVFSAWVLWHKENPQRKDSFDWRTAAWTLHVPIIRALFEQLATPAKLGALGLIEVLDWTAAALNRVDRLTFFQDFVELHAVQYFYEPFLQAFDLGVGKQMGVWFTPPEIVRYMVACVDTVLRSRTGYLRWFC